MEWAFEPFLKWIGVASITRNSPFKTPSNTPLTILTDFPSVAWGAFPLTIRYGIGPNALERCLISKNSQQW